MTVYENLEYFFNIKNMSYTEIETEIDRMLELVSIPDKKHAFISSLSGGQKRKV